MFLIGFCRGHGACVVCFSEYADCVGDNDLRGFSALRAYSARDALISGVSL